MSITVMSQIWKHSTLKGGDLLVMLAIADNANDHGEAHPSIDTLARKARMTRRNLIYVLRRLEKTGELKIDENGGPKSTNAYYINMDLYERCCQKGGANSAWGDEKNAPEEIAPVKNLQMKNWNPKFHPNHQEPLKDFKEKNPPLIPPKGETRRPKKKRTYLPDDPEQVEALKTATLANGFQTWCDKKRIPWESIDEQWEAFTGKARANGYQYLDWPQAFRNWLTSPYQYAGVNGTGGPRNGTRKMTREELLAYVTQKQQERERKEGV